MEMIFVYLTHFLHSKESFLFFIPGVNPDTIRGSKTGVFIGCSASEAHDAWSCDPEKTVGYSMTGCTRSMFANRLSFYFDFKGSLNVHVLHV